MQCLYSKQHRSWNCQAVFKIISTCVLKTVLAHVWDTFSWNFSHAKTRRTSDWSSIFTNIHATHARIVVFGDISNIKATKSRTSCRTDDSSGTPVENSLRCRRWWHANCIRFGRHTSCLIVVIKQNTRNHLRIWTNKLNYTKFAQFDHHNYDVKQFNGNSIYLRGFRNSTQTSSPFISRIICESQTRTQHIRRYIHSLPQQKKTGGQCLCWHLAAPSSHLGQLHCLSRLDKSAKVRLYRLCVIYANCLSSSRVRQSI